MRLTDLNPRFVGAGGEGITDRAGKPVPERHGVGLAFDCPCGCDSRGYVGFENPLDGGPAHTSGPKWKRVGDTCETLTLTPSIHVVKEWGGCGWHGFITKGEVRSA